MAKTAVDGDGDGDGDGVEAMVWVTPEFECAYQMMAKRPGTRLCPLISPKVDILNCKENKCRVGQCP